MSWNGMLSKVFTIENGVKQGGNVSPVLFCIYIDGLLHLLRESNVGCFTGNVFVGALAYADDIALFAPTPGAIRHLLLIREEYGKKFSIKFNAAKLAWLYFSKGKQPHACLPQFSIDGNLINRASEYIHLGHIILPTWMTVVKF